MNYNNMNFVGKIMLQCKKKNRIGFIFFFFFLILGMKYEPITDFLRFTHQCCEILLFIQADHNSTSHFVVSLGLFSYSGIILFNPGWI